MDFPADVVDCAKGAVFGFCVFAVEHGKRCVIAEPRGPTAMVWPASADVDAEVTVGSLDDGGAALAVGGYVDFAFAVTHGVARLARGVVRAAR